MPMNYLGKVLFPRQAQWQRKRQLKIMIWVIMVSVVFAVTVGAIILLQNSRR